VDIADQHILLIVCLGQGQKFLGEVHSFNPVNLPEVRDRFLQQLPEQLDLGIGGLGSHLN